MLQMFRIVRYTTSALLFGAVLSSQAFAATPIARLQPHMQMVADNSQALAAGLGGLAFIAAGSMAMFGKTNWAWYAAIVGSLMLVSGSVDLIKYVTN